MFDMGQDERIALRLTPELHDRLVKFVASRNGKGPKWRMSDAVRYLIERSLTQLESR
jgi:predicted DNA-binding protein